MIYLERLKKIEEKLADIETRLSQPDAVKDQVQYKKHMKECSKLRPIVETFKEYQKMTSELEGVREGLKEAGDDEEMKALYQEEQRQLEEALEKNKVTLEDLLLQESDENVGRDVIMEIRAGTGGDEAALFVADLYRMYSKFVGEHGAKVEIMSSNATGMGGYKELVFSVTGFKAYSLLKYESGIHRVQRVPETESSGRIHTSAVTVAVMPEADETEVDIDTKDLKIDVYRASGAGGQHVNKTESAVRITHIPTGFVVQCQDERSQHKNKAKAMRVLRARLFEVYQQQHEKEMAETRKQQVGTGDRSGKIRTYNFQERRVTDHRIGLTLHDLDDILNGHLDDVVQALAEHERTQRLMDDAA